MTTLTITLPDDLAKVAEEQGLLSTPAIEAHVREKARKDAKSGQFPPGFDLRLKDAVDPAMVGRGRIAGDIVGPFKEEWGEKP